MNGRRPPLLALLVAAGLTCPARLALGNPLAAGTFKSKEAPAPIPSLAKDTLSGHILFHAGGLLSIPFGRLDSRTLFYDRAGIGYGAAGDLGIGVSRYVSVSGWFDYQKFNEASQECACDAAGLGFGLQARYHLVQGVRFDPWVSLGAGYRKLDVYNPDRSYSGVEWLRLGLGGDWYALSQLGFGPYASLTLGTFTERPERADAAVYGTVTFGISIALDVQGK